MGDKILVDTNILLYAYDPGEPVKQSQAAAVLNRLVTLRLGVLTPQVLAEFFVNAIRKLEPPLTVKQAYDRIENYLLSCVGGPGPDGADRAGGRARRSHLQDGLLGLANLGLGTTAPDSYHLYGGFQRWCRDRRGAFEDLEQETIARRQSEQLLKATLAAVPDMIFRLDREGRFLDFKPAKTFDPYLSPDQFLGKTAVEVLPAALARKTKESIARALDENTMVALEYQLP
ncbi:MAG: PAS domain-containing protein [Pseudomonadota bacterium]